MSAANTASFLVAAIALGACAAQPAPAPSSSPRPTATSVAVGASASAAPSQDAPPRRPSKTTTFRLHKFLYEIGAERDTFTPLAGGGEEAKATFSFQDRTATVP